MTNNNSENKVEEEPKPYEPNFRKPQLKSNSRENTCIHMINHDDRTTRNSHKRRPNGGEKMKIVRSFAINFGCIFLGYSLTG